MQSRFVRLCETSSPTGSQRQVTDMLAAELRDLGLSVSEDGAATTVGADAGNLVARLPGEFDRWVMFCAHLDTVPHVGPIEVDLIDGVYGSRGETILGADNKAAVTVIVELIKRAILGEPKVGIELVLTASEEIGLLGAKAFDLGTLHSEVGFVLDHASPIGEVITTAPTYQRLIADFQGREAHAGIRPEDGQSAIEAAAAAISAMKLGRIDGTSTANVGVIAGGTAGNVVPAHCMIEAEARSTVSGRASEMIGEMADVCAWAANDRGCDLDLRIEEIFRAYSIPDDSEALRLADAALRRVGIEPLHVATGGGSDSNAFVAAGFDSILLANGTTANHTAQETVSVAALESMLEVCEAIVEEAGRC